MFALGAAKRTKNASSSSLFRFALQFWGFFTFFVQKIGFSRGLPLKKKKEAEKWSQIIQKAFDKLKQET